MEVITASCAGACYGVKRALRLAERAAESGRPTQTLGPLIHNPQVVDRLAAKGVGVANSPAEVSGECVIIRSHGVTPQVRQDIEERGVSIIDATCPHVLRAQRAAKELAEEGRTVVVVGEKSHPEVEGLRAWAESVSDRVVVASDASELPADLHGPLGVVVQTTQRRAMLEDVLSELDARGLDYVLEDTICNATSTRQSAAEELASTVDAMVVIGGHNSSNTTRLYEICSAISPRTFHIETPGELKREDFAGCKRVGVTAGASTPDDIIQEVVRVLSEEFDA